MSPSMLACPRCHGELPDAFHNAPDVQPCPSCAQRVRVLVFPALLNPPAVGSTGETLLIEGESSCFYHPAKRASAACESCGRFLCQLCDVDLNGQHLCPSCLETGRRKGKLKQLENRRVLWDSVALMLALVPLLLFYFTIVTAPLTIFVVLRHWKDPTSIVGRMRWRMVVAMILAVLQMAGWAIILYFFMHLSGRARR